MDETPITNTTTAPAISDTALPGQLELFGTTAPSTSVIGLSVIMASPCTCGSEIVTIGASRAMHAARLLCAPCGRFRGWMSGESFRLITSIIDNFGRPTEPIQIRYGMRRDWE